MYSRNNNLFITNIVMALTAHELVVPYHSYLTKWCSLALLITKDTPYIANNINYLKNQKKKHSHQMKSSKDHRNCGLLLCRRQYINIWKAKHVEDKFL